MTELQMMLDEIGRRTGLAIRTSPQAGDRETAVQVGGKTVSVYFEDGPGADRTAALLGYLIETMEGTPRADHGGELRSVLLGEGGSWRAFRYAARLARDGACFAIGIAAEKHYEESLAHIESCLSEGDLAVAMDAGRIAVVRFAEADQSAYEFGVFLGQSLYEELGVKACVGVGCEVKSFSEIALSFAQAETALRMGKLFCGEWEVHSYREFLLVRMLEDVPQGRLRDYLEQFCMEGAAEIFEDEEMAKTADAFLECSLNISEASRNLYMHRNTLTYRLDKIEKTTGLNIRKFQDAVTFRVITILYKLLTA